MGYVTFGGTTECKSPKNGFLKGQSATQWFKVQREEYVSTYNKTKTDTR